jgi:hypothetical protein
LYLECRRRERRGFSRDAAAPASRFPGAGTKRAAMRRETKIEEVHACFSFALLPGPDAKKPRAAKTGEHREARRDDEAFLDEKNEISVADDAAPREVSRLNLAGPVVEMVASIRETLGWPSKGKVGAESDASADDDDAQKNVFFCACGTRRCAFLALPRSDGDALRMDRLMAHRFVLPPTAASFSTTTDASPPKNTPSSAKAGVHARRKSLPTFVAKKTTNPKSVCRLPGAVPACARAARSPPGTRWSASRSTTRSSGSPRRRASAA